MADLNMTLVEEQQQEGKLQKTTEVKKEPEPIIEKTFGVTTCDDVAVSSAAAVECTSTKEHGIIIRGDTYKHIGSVLLRKCEFTEAKDNFTKALELYRSMNLKEDDPRIAVTLDGILRVEHEEELCV